MPAAAWTNRVEVTIVAASCNLHNSVTNGNSVHTFTIPHDNTPVPEQTIQFPVPMTAGSLVVVAASLAYMVSKQRKQVPMDNVLFMPSRIVGAMYV